MSLRNRKLVGWEIFYDDGTVLNSEFNKWEECKQTGVQVVKKFYSSDNGIETNIHHNEEYYFLDDLLEVPQTIKMGRGMQGDKFYLLLEKAKNSNRIITTMK